MKKVFVVALIIYLVAILFAPVNTYALSSKHVLEEKTVTDIQNVQSNYNQSQNCNSLLGNPSYSNSVAWLVQKILNYIQVIGPLLVVVLSSIDFAKVIIKSDDEAMAKAQKKLIIRLILAACLFFIPTLVTVILATFGITSDPTCGIK